GGIVLVVAGAEAFFDGLLGTAARIGVAPFALTLVVSGFEPENLATGIAANLKGLGNAAAGTFLGGTTFLALGVAGLAAAITPLIGPPPGRALVWAAAAPIPLFALALDGRLSRLDGGLLVVWFGLALAGIARSGGAIVEREQPAAGRFPLVRVVAGLALLSGGGEVLGEG